MKSRLIFAATTALMVTALASTPAAGQGRGGYGYPHERFSVVEATIPELVQAMEQGRTTSREIVEQYLQRIATYEVHVHVLI